MISIISLDFVKIAIVFFIIPIRVFIWAVYVGKHNYSQGEKDTI